MNDVPLPLVIANFVIYALAASLFLEDLVRRVTRRLRRGSAEPRVSTAEKQRQWLAQTEQPARPGGPEVADALAVLADAEQRLARFYR